jgi:Protein of unknown function (DUF4232)
MSWSARRRARYRRYALRTVAVVAFGGTAALAVVLTRVPAQQATLTAEDTACTRAGLMALAPVGTTPDGAVIPRSASTYTLEFVNISHRTCVLEGYPSVDAYAGTQQVGSPATLDTSVMPRTVTLAPGGIAHATLRYTGTRHFQQAACHQVTTSWLHVWPPHLRRTRAIVVPWRVPVCARRGASVLTVAAIQPRSGLLGSSRY